MKPQKIWSWTILLFVAGVAVGIAYGLRNAPLSIGALGWLGVGIVVLLGYFSFAGGSQERDGRLVGFHRGLNCLLAALAWMLLAAPFVRLWFATDPYAQGAITLIPAMPLVSVGIVYIVRTFSSGRLQTGG